MSKIEQEVDNAVRSAALSPDVGPWGYYPYATEGFAHLREHVPAGEERCLFIPEIDAGMEPLPVYDCSVDAVVAILSRCFLFEYYVVGKGTDWIVIDTDHGQHIVWKRNAGVTG